MNKQALIDGLKEMGRIVLLGVVAYLLTGGLENLLNSFDISVSVKLEITALVTLILKGVDEFLHELGKSKENESLTRGLTRF